MNEYRNTAFYDCGRVIVRSKTDKEHTFTVHVKGYHLTRKIINRADHDIHSGMIEEVLPNLISYHDLKANDINKAFRLITKYFGHTLVTVEEEHYHGCYCHNKFIVAVQL